MNKTKLAYYISTGLLTVLLTFGAIMYFVQYEMVSEMFLALGYPTHIIYPLATAKLLGLLAVWTRKSELLKNLAYAGFFYDLILATIAHFVAQDGGFVAPLMALALVVISYTAQRRMPFADQAAAAPAHAQVRNLSKKPQVAEST